MISFTVFASQEFRNGTLVLSNEVQSAHFIFGGEAKRVCEAYKLICPAKKVCVLQSIEWPRTMKFPVCIHDTHVVVKSDICRKPPNPGKCQAQFMRWYFNVHMGTCSWFTYSGCGGNQNKFRTAEECESRCMGLALELVKEKHHRHNMTTTEAESVSDGGQILRLPKGSHTEDREPKLITAPARAAEMIELTSNITSSLQLSTNSKHGPGSGKNQKKRRRGKDKRKRQKNRRNKNRNNSHQTGKTENVTTDAAGTTAHAQLVSNVSQQHWTLNNETEYSRLVEFKGRPTYFASGIFNHNDKNVWMIDKKFKRRDKKYRNKSMEPATKARSDTLDVKSGAKQDTYYDNVKLFGILANEDTQNTTHAVS